ncbi:hypothetical protein HY375_02095 [Candidatus Berkelbacteria bacterium]|nr:hypothetical protein [Candidatus Berkelbacteria bacterium]
MSERRRPDPHYERLPAREYFGVLNKDPNEYRDPTALWENVSETIEELRRGVDREEVPLAELRPLLIGVYGALRIYTLRQFIDPNRAILEKYPGYCPYCHYDECHCPEVRRGLVERREPMPPRPILPQNELIRPEQAQRLLERVYGRTNEPRTVSELSESFFKEATEVEEWIEHWAAAGNAFTPEDAQAFTYELADLFARLYAVMTRLGIDIGNELAGAGGPPYGGTRRPKIAIASIYTPIPQLDE